MRKTFVTTMPDQAGAFLKAARLIARQGANITRVSYNKAIDAHMLFIDVAGEAAAVQEAEELLAAIGYISDEAAPEVVLLEFELADKPGAVVPVLELIERYNFNISYIDSSEDDGVSQAFRMGLYSGTAGEIEDFLVTARQLCPVRVVEYDPSEQPLDNTVFYRAFAKHVSTLLDLDISQHSSLIAYANQLMQMLASRGEQARLPFERIGQFAEKLAAGRGGGYMPRVSRRLLDGGFALVLIEPPCGSNTYVLEHTDSGELLLVDGGFAYLVGEQLAVLEEEFPGFAQRSKTLYLTHSDADHCGLVEQAEQILASELACADFANERVGLPNSREQKPEHAPYIRISKLLCGYVTPAAAKLKPAVGGSEWQGLRFIWHPGLGGHSTGDVVIECPQLGLVFSGDLFVNVNGFTKPQADFNLLAPYLMTSVNMDSALASEERRQLLAAYQGYTLCPGHGLWLEQ
ncbi:MAG: hypothetical protein LBR39_04185 [Coriobacteriales bacterium]|nr:hypothetical protein [Coriobacteriales bacterium]